MFFLSQQSVRLAIHSLLTSSIRSIHLETNPLCFKCTPLLSAEPLKKKKRIDPQVLRERAEKKVKRIQRDIRRLEKGSKQLKPIAELEVPRKILRDPERVRPPVELSKPEKINREQLQQDWSIYKGKQHDAYMKAIQRITDAQERALDALKEASPELYEQAVQPDPMLIPFTMMGPVETPPIEGFDYPDGEYINVTKEYVPIVPLDVNKQRKLGIKKKK